MANKKAGLYGTGSNAIGRKLGRHLPRIASGDGNEDWPVDKPEEEEEEAPLVPRRSRFREAATVEADPSADRERKRAEREREKAERKREEGEALKEIQQNRKARRGPWVRDDKPLPSEPLSPTPPFQTPSKRVSVVLQGLPSFPGPPTSPKSPKSPNRGITLPEPPGDDVQGMQGRLRLSKTPGHVPEAPLPKTAAPVMRFGLWADIQRHLLQAYEYLCHIGEAQQWIEGCLGEELGFGVVEMEEGMRNGVVLAKLARVFEGEAVVRKIYEVSLEASLHRVACSWSSQHPKLSFRHSDNINIFLDFVRELGLPEVSNLLAAHINAHLAFKCFVFELIDLYDKKNIPKVIYCIHALRSAVHYSLRSGVFMILSVILWLAAAWRRRWATSWASFSSPMTSSV